MSATKRLIVTTTLTLHGQTIVNRCVRGQTQDYEFCPHKKNKKGLKAHYDQGYIEDTGLPSYLRNAQENAKVLIYLLNSTRGIDPVIT